MSNLMTHTERAERERRGIENERKVRVAYGGHVIEGDVEIGAGATRDNKVEYSLSLTGGYFVCGPHDAEGNHIEEAAK